MTTGSVKTFAKLFRESPREVGLIIASALILVSLTIFSLWLTHRVAQDVNTAHELSKFAASLTKLVKVLRTVESNHRGYLLTGDEGFLKSYMEKSVLLKTMVESLAQSAPSILKETGNVTALAAPLSAKLEEMAQGIALDKAGKRDEAIARVKINVGRELTTEIEDQVQALLEKSKAIAQKNEASTLRLQNFKFAVDAVGSLLVITLSFLSLWLLLRSNAAIHSAREALAQSNVGLENTVTQRTTALKRANEEIQRFAYIVSHDLRSPLVNIMGFTAELETLRAELFKKLKEANALSGSETLYKDFDEAFRFIKSSIARMDRLIAAILKISRDGSRPLKAEAIDVSALVAAVVSGITHQIREKDARLVVGSLPGLTTDRLSLEQIFSNLIENAVKFLKADGHGEIKIDGTCRGIDVIYSVRDNGRGIDPKDHKRIFELFRRSGPQDVPGEGMGLAYVSALVRRLGGTIAIESELGHGSTFTLTLPACASLENRKAA